MYRQRKKRKENTLKFNVMIIELVELIGCAICAIAFALYLISDKKGNEKKEGKTC